MSDNRIVAGTVDADAKIKNGSGFSVSRTSTGHYQVSFRPAFHNVSGASVTQVYPEGSTLDNAVIISLSNTDLFLQVGNVSGKNENRDFSFVAVGVGTQDAK